MITEPEKFQIDCSEIRSNATFGLGTPCCSGDGLAEMQLYVVWEEAPKRFSDIEWLKGEPAFATTLFAVFHVCQCR